MSLGHMPSPHPKLQKSPCGSHLVPTSSQWHFHPQHPPPPPNSPSWKPAANREFRGAFPTGLAVLVRGCLYLLWVLPPMVSKGAEEDAEPYLMGDMNIWTRFTSEIDFFPWYIQVIFFFFACFALFSVWVVSWKYLGMVIIGVSWTELSLLSLRSVTLDKILNLSGLHW